MFALCAACRAACAVPFKRSCNACPGDIVNLDDESAPPLHTRCALPFDEARGLRLCCPLLVAWNAQPNLTPYISDRAVV